MTDDHEGYVFRFYCGQCKEAGGWHGVPEEARTAADEHESSHEDLYYPTRIQRFPADDPEAVRS